MALITVLLFIGRASALVKGKDDDDWGTGPGGCKLGPDGKCKNLYDCGNGFVEGNEQCDDGNTNNGDG